MFQETIRLYMRKCFYTAGINRLLYAAKNYDPETALNLDAGSFSEMNIPVFVFFH
jgi:hypothetical protein